jgi:20S proteasome subunit alpha 6
MFRNHYDSSTTTWSPQGRIHQIEYAMEAVKQGSATVGVKSKTHAVLVALKRAQNELSAHQKKCLRIAPHCGMSMAGLTADGRGLTNYMRTETLNYEIVYGSDMPLARLVDAVGTKLQTPTQMYTRRPFGVGLLIAGFDKLGPHIYQTDPSANYYSCKAMSIGSRSQSARTYLEKILDELEACGRNELVKHGLIALRETLPADQELTEHNVTVCIVGADEKFKEYNDVDVKEFLNLLDSTKKPAARRAEAAEEAAADGEAAAEEAPAAEQEPEQPMEE